MDNAIRIYQQPNKYPRLLIQQCVIKRAVRAFYAHGQDIEALALIRGAYASGDGADAPLDEAKEIYAAMLIR